MSESLILRSADVEALADLLVARVAARLEPLLVLRSSRRLVDRPTMAELANIGTATLDALVSARLVPSVPIGRRRLFDPDRTIEALAAVDPDAMREALRIRREGATDGKT